MCKAKELAKGFFNNAEEIRKEWKELHNRLSIADQKKTDVEHYIEIHDKLNAAQGYQAYKMLNEVLKERREIKDDIEELRPLMDFLSGTKVYDHNTKNKINQLISNAYEKNENADEMKKYRVRVLKEVFGETITA